MTHGHDILGTEVKCSLFLNFVEYYYLVIPLILLINDKPPSKKDGSGSLRHLMFLLK